MGCDCGPVPGAFWPCMADSDSGHMWVERHDECEVFESDDEAAWAVAQATGWPLRFAHVHGDESRPVSPYVEPFDWDGDWLGAEELCTAASGE